MHQSWSSSVISTLNALRYSLPLVFKVRPDVVSAGKGGGAISSPLSRSNSLLCFRNTHTQNGEVLYKQASEIQEKKNAKAVFLVVVFQRLSSAEAPSASRFVCPSLGLTHTKLNVRQRLSSAIKADDRRARQVCLRCVAAQISCRRDERRSRDDPPKPFSDLVTSWGFFIDRYN